MIKKSETMRLKNEEHTDEINWTPKTCLRILAVLSLSASPWAMFDLPCPQMGLIWSGASLLREVMGRAELQNVCDPVL